MRHMSEDLANSDEAETSKIPLVSMKEKKKSLKFESYLVFLKASTHRMSYFVGRQRTVKIKAWYVVHLKYN